MAICSTLFRHLVVHTFNSVLIHLHLQLFFYLTIAQMVEALCYKSEGREFDEVTEFSSMYLILPATLDSEVYSASNRNENQKIFLRSRARPVLKSNNFTAICEPIVWTMWDPQHVTTL
jgi:hypothetical protein